MLEEGVQRLSRATGMEFSVEAGRKTGGSRLRSVASPHAAVSAMSAIADNASIASLRGVGMVRTSFAGIGIVARLVCVLHCVDFVAWTRIPSTLMDTTPNLRPLLAVAFFATAVSSPCAAAEKLALDRVAIVVEEARPSYLQHAVAELADYLKYATGAEVPVGTVASPNARALIAVGPEAGRRVVGEALRLDGLGEEGYVLKSVRREGAACVAVAGATPRGTRAGVLALVRAIELGATSASVADALDLRHVPAYAKRGMHLNGWRFRNPYSFRTWREEEWRRYLDILALQGVNLFYLWPFMEIMPVPLSAEDRAYLQECRRVIAYAQEAHGMEVWIMQCTNRVARDTCGVDDPRLRPYWRPSQEDLDPGDAEQLRRILASREALYGALPNVDGVCNIDSDPGYFPGSPLEDYVKVLQGCRALLDRHNVHGRQAKLVHWMWIGWGLPHGRGFEPAHHARTLRLLAEHLPEPWEIVAGTSQNLAVCREAGLLGKTVFLPYSLIEDEPSYPATNLSLEGIRGELGTHAGSSPGLRGVMGNAQTPLIQLPNVYFLSAWCDDPASVGGSAREVLRELCRAVYPARAELLADSYLALGEPDPARVAAAADRLEGACAPAGLGRPGCIGRKLFPDPAIAARALVLQLRRRAAQERLASIARTAPSDAECVAIVRDYLDAYLAWDTAHGWHELWGASAWPLGGFADDHRFPAAVGYLRTRWGDDSAVDARLETIARELSSRHDARVLREGGIALLRQAIPSGKLVDSLAQKAKATASVTPNPAAYPPNAAIDGFLATLYWPGALVQDNAEWLQLSWDEPQRIEKVVVHFLKHPSMVGRTIRLQAPVGAGVWEDIATAKTADEPAAPHAVATFSVPSGKPLTALRIVNLLDLFEVEAY